MVHRLPANWKTIGRILPLRLLLLQLFTTEYDLKAALVHNGGVHYQFLHNLVIILYEMKKGELEVESDSWKYVSSSENPIVMDSEGQEVCLLTLKHYIRTRRN